MITRERMIETLKSIAPVVTQVTVSEDMGFEFSAVVPTGVIYAEPGMLLNYSGGQWPPNEWEGKSEEETHELLERFLLDDIWEVTAWPNLSDEEVATWLEEAKTSCSEQ